MKKCVVAEEKTPLEVVKTGEDNTEDSSVLTFRTKGAYIFISKNQGADMERETMKRDWT